MVQGPADPAWLLTRSRHYRWFGAGFKLGGLGDFMPHLPKQKHRDHRILNETIITVLHPVLHPQRHPRVFALVSRTLRLAECTRMVHPLAFLLCFDRPPSNYTANLRGIRAKYDIAKKDIGSRLTGMSILHFNTGFPVESTF